MCTIGTYNQNIHIYDINKQQHVKALFGHISSVTDLAVSLSGRFLFSSSLDATVQVKCIPRDLLFIYLFFSSSNRCGIWKICCLYKF